MLLSTDEVVVTPGGFRLFDYVSARIELRPVLVIGKQPSLSSTIFALITLGDPGSGQAIQADTNGFGLHEIPDYLELHRQWRELSSRGKVEQAFLEYLLSHLRASPEIRLEFLVDDGQLKKFDVRLGGKIELFGRFPEGVNVLSTYFTTVEVLQD